MQLIEKFFHARCVQLSNNLLPEDFPSLQELDKDSKTSFSFWPIPYYTYKVNHISSSGRLQRTILDWQLQTLKLFPGILFPMEEGKWAGSLAPPLNHSKPIDIQSSSSPDDI